MTFRLRRIDVTAGGRRIARDTNLVASRLTIGRAADCDLHVPDLSLDPLHAVLTLQDDGRITIEAAGSPGFGFDGRSVSSAAIAPGQGGELRFGRTRVTVGRDADSAVLLTLEEVAADDAEGAPPRFNLAGLVPGKRSMSWVLAVLVLLVFLIVPVASNLLRGAPESAGKAERTDRVLGDAAWSTGPLSLAHHTLGDRCEACHVRPFEAVRDETCLTCHKDTADHAAAPRLTAARGSRPLADQALWAVAHGFGKPGPGACTDCHTEHEGEGRMAAPPQKFCADCHGALDQRLAGTRLGNAADFGTLHPRFRPAVALAAGSDKLTRIPLTGRPREASGLTFPHNLHLDPRGGVARMAASIGGERGYGGSVLACKDCHRATTEGVRFQPIDMELDCEGCHSLAYDRVGTTFRRLRHGDVDQMVADLSVAPASSRTLVSGRARPGSFAGSGPYSARFAPAAGGIGLPDIALSRDGICGECHTRAASAGRFAVLPVTQVSRFMAHGWFSHRAHSRETCSTCHAAQKSASSSDVLLPDIATCRTCHMGEDARAPKVPSGCAMCHNYHLSAQAPRGFPPGDRR